VSLVRKPASFPDAAFAGNWAQLIVKPGLENCFKVSDTLYRGAQPTREGFEELKRMGIKTVINLRSNHSDQDLLPEGMRQVRIPMTVWKAETRQILQFLDTVTDPRNQPVFVHCQEGVDRTGLMCAVYRVLAGGWDKDQAVEEMKQIGAHDILVNLKSYLEKLDIEALRRQLLETPLADTPPARSAQK
jgi:protein tyrosine/serine phosphatase